MTHPYDIIHSSWLPLITGLMATEEMVNFRENTLPDSKYYPQSTDIFRVFSIPVSEIKVVILGQDPYFTPDTAIGRAFAVNGKKIPPSLRIIRKEIDRENVILYPQPECWQTLEHWERQGIMLLNTALTVESGKAGSHLKYWRAFTEHIISHLSTVNPCIWIMWGKKAQEFIPSIKGKTITVTGYDKDTIRHIPGDSMTNYILTAPHPAAEAYGNAGFYGCDHFIFTNEILLKNREFPIQW